MARRGFRNSIKNFSTYHCAPTKVSYKNLINENIDKKAIRITGNTIVDLLMFVQERFNLKSISLKKYKKYVYVTIHRRENQGPNLIKFVKD